MAKSVEANAYNVYHTLFIFNIKRNRLTAIYNTIFGQSWADSYRNIFYQNVLS